MVNAKAEVLRVDLTIIATKAWQLFSLSVVFVVLVTQLWIRLETVKEGYKLEELRSVLIRQDTRLRELRLRHAHLTQPGSVELVARTSLGLSQTPPQNVRILEIQGAK